ncbi:MAG TPA: DUF5985 family protein [Gemmatimonadaceae bacterium]|nr:DUF5985 family protein [Gemmatimonadaceae bacterium]
MIELISGALVAGYVVVALFFAKFWRRSGERLFAMFSGAFALLAVHRLVLALAARGGGATTWIYALRLLAFLVILAAIVDKNRDASETRAGRR